MGGTTSKLKENVWEKADGKLRSSNDTIDGAAPTTDYQVYYITKRAVNQRDFDITDSESNLLYTTRQVPGTIACFDLLGKEMNNYLIRVNVDIARRYWILYKFEEASFPGQKPDKEATERLVFQRLQEAEKNPGIESFNTTFLFRKAVVVVSWSRYMAVSSFYGPPTEKMIEDYELQRLASQMDSQSQHAPSTTDSAQNDTDETTNHIHSQSNGHKHDNEDQHDEQVEIDVILDGEIDTSDPSHDNSGPATSSDEKTSSLSTSQSMPNLAAKEEIVIDSPKSTSEHNGSQPPASEEEDPTKEDKRQSKLKDWAKKQTKTLKDKSRVTLEKHGLLSNILERDPREGILHLDRPLLLCQEIYNRIIGNHQTSLISKEKAIELLKKDIAQHQKEHPEDGKKDDKEVTNELGQELAPTELGDFGLGIPVEKIDEKGDSVELIVGFKSEEPEKEQPLVGYWLWENTFRTHKMKMHVAKGADLALHVVLAVIVNQVRTERNVVGIAV